MKRLRYVWLLTGCLSLALGGLQAQQAEPSNDTKKKVIVIRETVDDDGNTLVEKRIAEGVKADLLLEELQAGEQEEDMIWIEDVNGEDGMEKEIVIESVDGPDSEMEVEVIEENGHRTITIKKDGDIERVIELEDGAIFSNEEFMDGEDGNLFIVQRNIELDAAHDGEYLNRNIDIDIESENGESFIVMHQYGDGEEKVIKWRSKDGELPEDMEGELARIRIRKHHGDAFVIRGENHFVDKMQNCAALGVYVGTQDNVVRISNIIGSSGAEAAGLGSGDIIHSINGEEVRNFRELRHALSAYIPGDVVMVSYERAGEALNAEVQLKSWKDLPSMQNSYLSNIECDDIYNEDEQPVIEEGEDATPHDGVRTGFNQSPIQALALENFTMYPNPSDGKVRVSFNAEALPTLVKVMDATGKEVYQKNLDEFGGDFNEEIDLTDQAKGAFILMIEQAGKVFSEQIAVQ